MKMTDSRRRNDKDLQKKSEEVGQKAAQITTPLQQGLTNPPNVQYLQAMQSVSPTVSPDMLKGYIEAYPASADFFFNYASKSQDSQIYQARTARDDNSFQIRQQVWLTWGARVGTFVLLLYGLHLAHDLVLQDKLIEALGPYVISLGIACAALYRFIYPAKNEPKQ